jgi:putative ABC transport system substrate-binding protein
VILLRMVETRTMQRCTLGLLVTLTLVTTLVAVPLASQAQPAAKIQRIGWLLQGGPSPDFRDALLQGLRDMGYNEGQHFVIETRSGQGKIEPLAAFAAELVQLPVDVLVTNGIAATLAGRAATSTLPIVFVNVPEPVDRGLIASWAHPGGNLTGVANAGRELYAKQAQLLQEVVPTITRVAYLVNPDNPGYQSGRSAFQDLLRLLKIDMYPMPVRGV